MECTIDNPVYKLFAKHLDKPIALLYYGKLSKDTAKYQTLINEVEKISESAMSDDEKSVAINSLLEQKFNMTEVQKATLSSLNKAGKGVSYTEEGHKYNMGSLKVEATSSILGRDNPLSNHNGMRIYFDKEEWKKTNISRLVENGMSKQDAEDQINKMLEQFEKYPRAGSLLHGILEFAVTDSLTLAQAQDMFKKEKLLSPEIIEKTFQLGQKLRKEIFDTHGGNAQIISEKRFAAELSENGKQVLGVDAIAGTGDVIVIDASGNVHTYDWKFSGKSSDAWYKSKEESVKYQQLIYKKILSSHGIYVKSSNFIPLVMELDDEGKPTDFTSSEKLGVSINDSEKELFLNTLFNVPEQKTADFGTLKEYSKVLFGYELTTSIGKTYTEQQARDWFAKQDSKNITMKRVAEKTFTLVDGAGQPRIDDIIAYLNARAAHAADMPNNFVNLVQRLQADPNETIPGWLSGINVIAHKYINDYRIISAEGTQKRDPYWKLEAVQGAPYVIATNSVTGNIEIIDFSSDDNDSYVDPKNKSIGHVYYSERESMAMKFMHSNTVGNARMATALIHLLNNRDIRKVERVITVAENYANARATSPGALLSDIKKIMDKVVPMQDPSNIKSLLEDPYAFDADPYESLKSFAAAHSIHTITKGLKALEGKYTKNFRRALQERAESDKEQIAETIQFFAGLQKTYLRNADNDPAKLATLPFSTQIALNYINQIILAAKEVRLALEDDLQLYGYGFLFTENKTTTRPDNIQKAVIRAEVDLFNYATRNIQNKMVEAKEKLAPAMEQLRQEYGLLKQRTMFDTREMYKNMFKYRKEGDRYVNTYILRDPDNDAEYLGSPNRPPDQLALTDAEKNFIRIYVEAIGWSKETSAERRFELPLMRASETTLLKSRLQGKKPGAAFKEWFNYMQETYANPELLFNDDAKREARENFLEIHDSFRRSKDVNERPKMLDESQSQNEPFEDDLELVFYHYHYKNARREEINNILPAVHAARAVLTMSRFNLLMENPNLVDLLNSELRTKFFGRTLKSEEEEKVMKPFGALQNIAATALLAISPVTSMTNILANFLTTITAVTGVGADRIKPNDFRKAFTFITTHAPKNVDSTTFFNMFVEKFGIQQMEGMEMVNRMSEYGRNFWNSPNAHLQIMNSYPDLMFRTALFMAEMMNDGTLIMDNSFNISPESAVYMEDGKVKYNVRKDKRFNLLFDKDADKKSEAYLKQKALYDYYVNELRKEYGGVEMLDNIEGVLEKGVLKTPYTYKDVQSKVKFADMIYAETSASNKSDWEKTAFGSLWMMFKRYPMAKIDLYFQSFKIDEVQGYIDYIETTDANGEKSYKVVWKGRPMEGIMLSAWSLLNQSVKMRDPLNAYKTLEEYQKRNLNHLAMDTMMWLSMQALIAAIGMADDEEKSGASEIAKRIIYNSSRDMYIMSTLSSLAKGSNMVSVSFAENMVRDFLSDTVNPQSLYSNTLENIGLFRTISQLSQ